MQLSVIIINYNVKYFLEHCLLSVLKACKGIDAEILVADNGSADGSREYLIHKFSTIRFFWNNDNRGFAKANNQLLAHCKGEHILFLNPDTIVPENCFTECLDFFAAHADSGAIGVRMMDGSGKFLPESKRCLPSPATGFFKLTGLAAMFPRNRFFAGYYAGHLPENENNKAEVLAGAFMMLSKKATDITKGFDEDFFMYGEDIDLSYRIMQAGLSNYYCGQITIIHFKGESTQKQSPAYTDHFYGAMKRFTDKHYRKNRVKNVLMKSVISAGKYIAKRKAKNNLSKNSMVSLEASKMLVLGNEKQMPAIKIILEAKNILSVKYETGIAGMDAAAILSAIKKEKITIVIFCEGSLSNKFIAEVLPQLPCDCMALFYEDGAGSIIGSNDKNSRGIFISANG